MMIHVVYQLFNSFGLNKRLLPLFSEKEPGQLRLPDYVKMSYGLTTSIKDKQGKVIIIDTKDAEDLMDQVSKNGITYNEVKTIFNDKIIKSATIIILEKPSNNRTNLLKLFFIWEKFLLKGFTALKMSLQSSNKKKNQNLENKIKKAKI